MSSASLPSKGDVVLIGTGTVAKSWATIFSRSGYDVWLYNTEKGKIDLSVKEVVQNKLPALKQQGLLRDLDNAVARVHGVDNLCEVLSKAILVQECVPESLDLKKQVWGDLDRSLTQCKSYRKDIVLASSSSNILVSKFTQELGCRENCVNTHPVNPPSAIPVVELVPAPWTLPETISRTRTIMTDIGMSPVTLKKGIDGFLVNRLQYALLSEGVRLVQEGICSPEDIDTTITDGLARRWVFMGPFATIDLNAPKGVKDYCERYAESIHDVVAQQDNSVVWKDDTIERIDSAMRRVNGPVETLPARAAWRDKRLANLQLHLESQSKLDETI